MVKKTQKPGILAWPAFSNKAGNPYNFLIYKEISNLGYPVYDFDFNVRNLAKFVFSPVYSVFHIHWPANILTHSTKTQAKRRIFMLGCFLKAIKLSGKKVVWTVHNIQGHEADHPRLQQQLNELLFAEVNGFISLNNEGLKLIKDNARQRKSQKFAYIPHPTYKGYYENDIGRAEARKRLKVSPDQKVFLFIGQIRKYKNVSGLIDAFKALDLPGKLLIIAGKVHEELLIEVMNAVANHSDIMLHNQFIEDSELQVFLNASDLVVNPYTHIFNSGSIFLNLSFHKPTLVPNKGTFIELEKDLGPQLVMLYDGAITASHLEEAMLKTAKQTSAREVEMEHLDPEFIARQTLKFYESLL